MMVDVRQLEQAVLCAYDPSSIATVPGANRGTIKAQATSFCEEVRRSAQGWQSALILFRTSGNVHAKLFALSSLQDSLGGRQIGSPVRLQPPERLQVKAEIMEWTTLPLIEGLEPFIRTKLAVVLVLLIKLDYPDRWENAFAEIIQFVRRGSPAMVELFLRVLLAFDEEIVMYHVDRPKEENLQNTRHRRF